jgi:hypothetical protein
VEVNDEEVHMGIPWDEKAISHKLQLVERDYINKVIGKNK